MKIKQIPPILLAFFLLFQEKLTAQIGINASNTPPATNAMLDISSTTKGLLIPRMTTAQRSALSASDGLTVYDTDTKGYWFYNGTSWQSMSGGGSSPWLPNGNNIYYNTGKVGIGEATPGFPLNFGGSLGDKISLFGNTGAHYGFGVQNGLLQMHGDDVYSNIAFGYGSSTNLIERMRIINGGGEGMQLFGRLTMRNGTIPIDLNYGSGIWLYKADDSGKLGFMGAMNNQNVGFFGGPGLWGFVYDAINSRVGIGTTLPDTKLHVAGNIKMVDGTQALGKVLTSDGNGVGSWQTLPVTATLGWTESGNNVYKTNLAGNVGIGTNSPGFPLNFSNSLGDKIALWGNTADDPHYGFGIQDGLLQIYTDEIVSDVAFGYGQSNDFTETMRVKGNGALALKGNMGAVNQILTSNGANVSPEWKTPVSAYNNLYQLFQSDIVEILPGGPKTDLPGMTQSITVVGNAKIIITFNISSESILCFGCGHTRASVEIYRDATFLMSFTEAIPNGNEVTTSGTYIASVGPGTYNFNLKGFHESGPTVRYWGVNTLAFSNMTLQVVNE